jgi:hypothetical protein
VAVCASTVAGIVNCLDERGLRACVSLLIRAGPVRLCNRDQDMHPCCDNSRVCDVWTRYFPNSRRQALTGRWRRPHPQWPKVSPLLCYFTMAVCPFGLACYTCNAFAAVLLHSELDNCNTT